MTATEVQTISDDTCLLLKSTMHKMHMHYAINNGLEFRERDHYQNILYFVYENLLTK